MLRFDPIEHKYWWDTDEGSIEIPSVSRLLEPLREPFSAPLDVVDKARRRGERVHLMTHQHDTGQYVDTFSIEPDIYDDCMMMFDEYVEWVKGREVAESEYRVHYVDDEDRRYGGTLDKRYHIDGGSRISDIKCTYKISKVHKVQAVMYHIAYYGVGWEGKPPPSVVHISKEPKIKEHILTVKEMICCAEITLGLVSWYYYKNRRQ